MRLSVDKWILTTVKKNALNETKTTPPPLREEIEEDSLTKSDLIIEQQVTVEQSLYQEDELSSKEELDTTSSNTEVEIEIKHESSLDEDQKLDDRPCVRKLVSSIESNLAKSSIDKSVLSSPKQLTSTTSNTPVHTSSKSQLNLNNVNIYLLTFFLSLYSFACCTSRMVSLFRDK